MTLREIDRLSVECAARGWDGYGASALDPGSASNAVRLVLALPREVAGPEVTVEPDGEIALEWHVSPQRFLIVGIGRGSELSYTWRVGHEREWGVRHFEDEIPSDVLGLLARVVS